MKVINNKGKIKACVSFGTDGNVLEGSSYNVDLANTGQVHLHEIKRTSTEKLLNKFGLFKRRKELIEHKEAYGEPVKTNLVKKILIKYGIIGPIVLVPQVGNYKVTLKEDKE